MLVVALVASAIASLVSLNVLTVALLETLVALLAASKTALEIPCVRLLVKWAPGCQVGAGLPSSVHWLRY